MRTDDPLDRALRKLRSLRPSPEFAARLAESLAEVDRKTTTSRARRVGSALHRRLVITLPALASVAVAAHLLIAERSFDASRIAEHTVEIPAVGPAALDLGLWLDQHEADFASVRVHVPHGLKLTPSPEAQSEETDCHATGCVHEFLHPTDDEAPHVRVEVSRPGRYHMKVEHASDGRRVREVFVVHARR
jgi:hypothetical protein